MNMYWPFLDFSQVTKGHTLIIPKVHKENLFELTPEIAKNIFEVVTNNCQCFKRNFQSNWFKCS